MKNKISVIKRDGGVPVKMWNEYVPPFEDKAVEQLLQIASMPFVKPHVAAMADCHLGMGATVGSVIPTVGAVMPAAVGVDIGCGMIAVRTNLTLDKEDGFVTSPTIDHQRKAMSMPYLFDKISKAVPHGRSNDGGPGDRGAWGTVPADIHEIWKEEFDSYIEWSAFIHHPQSLSKNAEKQFGTLGTGNHFIELAVEIDNPGSKIWVVLHSGSRGFGNRIGSYYTKLAREQNEKNFIKLPNRDLGYLVEGTQEFDDYIYSVNLAQKFAWRSREIMMNRVLKAIGAEMDSQDGYVTTDGFNPAVPPMIHVHHNYMEQSVIRGEKSLLTRKGAVDASIGKWVIIPGSMGAKTYLGTGEGNPESFHSCSHGAGRAMSRTEALKTFTVAEHAKATEGVYCDKTEGTLDETPKAYKDIDAVMESQKDLVTPVIKLKQIVSVKGVSD